MTIRSANIKDVPSLVKMGRAFFHEAAWHDVAEWDDEGAMDALINLVNEPACVLLVAEHEEKVCGMASALIFPLWFNPKLSVAQEWFWYVIPEKRGVIGLKLLNALEATIKERGVHVMIMLAVEGMPSLEKVYKRVGYRPAERTFIKALTWQ